MASGSAYQSRIAAEQRFFKDCVDVHNLPEIFHYWSNKYVLPKLQALGFKGSIEFMIDPIQWQGERNPGRVIRCLSLGSGNCDQEIRIASQLRARGFTAFQMECLDLNETMLERGQAAATEQGLADNFIFTAGDFNQWRPSAEYDAEYDVVLAIQALHHVMELEHLFTAIKDALRPTGVFVVSDMIGRNGHMRWPEALSIIQEFWSRLPPSYRYNNQLKRYDEEFVNWDCSHEGFEGIRAQDILPLLNSTFHFERFIAFGNVIDPFVDRGFGHNFNASAEWDRAFIDEIHRRDDEGMRNGTLKPTHMFAILRTQDNGPTMSEEPFSPSFCIRPPTSVEPAPSPGPIYAWDESVHDKSVELQTACARLAQAERRILELTAELEKRTAWALALNREYEERTAWALELNRLLEIEKSRPALAVTDPGRARRLWRALQRAAATFRSPSATPTPSRD